MPGITWISSKGGVRSMTSTSRYFLDVDKKSMQILDSPRYIPSLAEKDSEMTKVENINKHTFCRSPLFFQGSPPFP